MEYYDLNQIQQLAPFAALNLGEDGVSSSLKLNFERHRIHPGIWDNAMLKNRLPETKFILRYFESESAIYKSVASCKSKGTSSHTIDSPFNPESDLYPNGILSSNWFCKYINKLPFCVISVHQLHSNRSLDGELGATLAAFKSKYLKFGVRYVALIVSSGKDIEEESNRVTVLRQISELSKSNGLFYLNTNPRNFQKDCDVLVTSILTSLKQVAVEFYAATETRIRQRYGKYYTLPSREVDTKVELTPKILEVRNLIKRAVLLQFIHPNSVDHCLPVLERAYEGLIDLMRNLEHVFFSPAINSHDSKLYRQYRSLLDIIAIHLIRGYFSVEEPVAALRKHKAHIDNVLDVLRLRPDTEQKVWEAIQYQWLAELMCYLPKTALTDLNYTKTPRSKNNYKGLVYYGGISFHDNFYSQIVTDPSLLYMRAASKVELVTRSLTEVSYVPFFPDLRSLQMHRINLLKMAERLQLEDSSSVAHENNGLQCFLNWQIAEEYGKVGNDEDAIHHYTRALSRAGSTKWGSIEQLVLLKIVTAFEKLEETENVLKWIPRLFSLQLDKRFENLLTNISMKGPYDIVLESGPSSFQVDVLVFNKNLKKEFYVFDTIVLQLSLGRIIKNETLDLLFPECEQTHIVKSVEITMTDDLKVTLHGSEDYDVEFEAVELDEDFKSVFGGLMSHIKKTIQFEKDVTCSGWFGIRSVKVLSELSIKVKDLNIKYTYKDIHELSRNDLQQSLKIIQLEPDGSLVTKSLMPEPQTAARVFARPYKPNIKLVRKMSSPLLIAFEKLNVPFIISHKSLAKKLHFSSVTIELQSYVKLSLGRRDDLTVQTNWESLKDDQPLNLLEFLNSDEDKCTKMLQICVRGPRVVEDENSPLFAVLVARIIVREVSGAEAIYDLDEYRFYIALSPFKTRITIGPASDSNGNLAMPNPFILNLESEEVQKYFSMPLSLRDWVVKALMDDYLKLIEDGEIEVTLVGVEIKSDNPDAIITKTGDSTIESGVVTQYFTTESIHRFPHRNLNISTALTFDWKRRGSEVTNKFEPKEVQLLLPLQDPRVLMQVQAKNDTYRLTYTIENPTPRILTFTAGLDTAAAKAEGMVWQMDDLQSVAPPEQTPFPVLPYSQFKLEYVGTLDRESKETPAVLPRLHVFDVNYKVSLPTLPVDEHVLTSGTKLVLKI